MTLTVPRLLLVEAATDAEQRPRPHSSLIRQSSWSGLSESSSHESLTGPLVKSSSLSSIKTPADGEGQRHPQAVHSFTTDTQSRLFLK